MLPKFFLQMSGAPGSGKTTVATAVATATDAIIIDHDITKSALLDADVPVGLAGRASYKVLHALANHLLMQGKSVIFDSPCFYTDLLERGMQLAQRHGIAYLYIECRLKDLDELDRRLRSRKRHRSQVAGIRAQATADSGKQPIDEDLFLDWISNMKRPDGNYLVLDTSASIEEVTQTAVAYVTSRIGEGTDEQGLL